MAVIYEAVRRSWYFDRDIRNAREFLSLLPVDKTIKVHGLLEALSGINRKAGEEGRGVRFSLVGKRVLKRLDNARTDFDFLIVNNAKEGTNLRGDAVDFLTGELKTFYALGSFTAIYESDEYSVYEIGDEEPLRFIVQGKNQDDSYTLETASDVSDQWTALLNPPPVTFDSF